MLCRADAQIKTVPSLVRTQCTELRFGGRVQSTHRASEELPYIWSSPFSVFYALVTAADTIDWPKLSLLSPLLQCHPHLLSSAFLTQLPATDINRQTALPFPCWLHSSPYSCHSQRTCFFTYKYNSSLLLCKVQGCSRISRADLFNWGLQYLLHLWSSKHQSLTILKPSPKKVVGESEEGGRSGKQTDEI